MDKKRLVTFLIIGALILWYLHSMGLVSLPKSCPEGIIPERVLLGCDSRDLWGACIGNPSKWADGTIMVSIYGEKPPNACHSGNKEGENINYWYCDSFPYSKTLVNEDGTLKKKIELKIDLIIDSKDKTEEGYKVVDYKCKI